MVVSNRIMIIYAIITDISWHQLQHDFDNRSQNGELLFKNDLLAAVTLLRPILQVLLFFISHLEAHDKTAS